MSSAAALSTTADPADSVARRPYLPALTGVRALVPYFVFLMHFSPYLGAESGGLLVRTLRQFHIGVTLFFVLSGFVISARYLPGVELTRQWFSRYWRRRFARIYPMYFLLSLPVLAQQLLPAQGLGGYARVAGLSFLSLSLLRGFSSTLKFVGIPQAWSLTAVECFYVTVPWLLLALSRRRWRALLLYPLALLATGLLLTLIGYHLAWHGFFSSLLFLFNYTLFGRSFEFMCGVLLALALHQGRLTPVTGWPWRTMLGLAWMVGVLAILVHLNSPSDFVDGRSNPYSLATNNWLLPPGIALFFAGLIRERSLLRRLFETRLMGLLGRSSYVFYLLHISTFSIWFRAQVSPNVGLQFLATVLVSVLGYQYLERPLHRWFAGRR